MQITLIGSGNVAHFLGLLFLQHNHTIVEVYSKNFIHAQSLAIKLHSTPIEQISNLSNESDLYILAVSDIALSEVVYDLNLTDKLLIHTSGSVPKSVLASASTNYGVIWPMRMIRKSTSTSEPFTAIVDGSSFAVVNQLKQIATQLTNKVVLADDAQRLKMHMVASLTANFSNHLYYLAKNYCDTQNIDFEHFYSLIEASSIAIQKESPAQLQAGPAFRGDLQTIEKHLHLLNDFDQINTIYKAMSQSILLTHAHSNLIDTNKAI